MVNFKNIIEIRVGIIFTLCILVGEALVCGTAYASGPRPQVTPTPKLSQKVDSLIKGTGSLDPAVRETSADQLADTFLNDLSLAHREEVKSRMRTRTLNLPRAGTLGAVLFFRKVAEKSDSGFLDVRDSISLATNLRTEHADVQEARFHALQTIASKRADLGRDIYIIRARPTIDATDPNKISVVVELRHPGGLIDKVVLGGGVFLKFNAQKLAFRAADSSLDEFWNGTTYKALPGQKSGEVVSLAVSRNLNQTDVSSVDVATLKFTRKNDRPIEDADFEFLFVQESEDTVFVSSGWQLLRLYPQYAKAQ